MLFLYVLTFASAKSFAADELSDEFNSWLEKTKTEAIASGISENTVNNALHGIKPIKKVIELDKKQPHKTITFSQYLKNMVSRRRIVMGKKLAEENKILLNKIAKEYKVQPRFIVALWGIETDFGRNTGDFYVPESLATLAFDDRRREFFKEELISALKILDNGDIGIKQMKGSWAGAMGQTQFMPSSFIKYSVDYNGDGKRDIWNSREDIFASIANYLSSFEWDDSATWGRKVELPAKFNEKLADMEIEKTLDEWNKIGLRKIDGKELPGRDLMASLIILDENKAFLVYSNYKRILKWNRSLYFATAVGILSDSIGYIK